MKNMDIPCIATLLVMILHVVTATRHVVFWDREMIPELGEDGLAITLEVDDWMDVLCPYYPLYDNTKTPQNSEVYLQIYNVTEVQYRNCDTSNGIRLQSCDDPLVEKKLTTKFQERSPYPFGFTFRPGATYYYLSKPADSRSRGCTKHIMKMSINVKRRRTVVTPEEQQITKTYHRNNEDRDSSPNNGMLPKFPKPAEPGKPKRHNHHERVTSTHASTKATDSIRLATAKNEPVRAGPTKNEDSDNGATRTFSAVFILLSSAATIIISIFLTDFGLVV